MASGLGLREDGHSLPVWPPSRNPRGVGSWHLPFKTSFPPNFQLEGLTRMPRRTWHPQPRLGLTNPGLKRRNGAPGATCCFAGSRALEEMHPACRGFSSRGSRLPLKWRSHQHCIGPGRAFLSTGGHAPLCDFRQGASPRRQEAPEQPGVLVPSGHLQRHHGGTRAEGSRGHQRALSGDRRLELAHSPEQGWVDAAGPCAPQRAAAADALEEHSCTTSASVGNGLHGSSDCALSRLEKPSWGRAWGHSRVCGVWHPRGGLAGGHLGPRHSTTPLPFMPSKKKKLL